ncbi:MULTISPECIES: RNA methyltransferase [Burkholderia cepacia complex]|uniref:tRNA/rRNA methyltransferase n=1 Tax=Burkholderia multivorans CGD2 TaxID=513052 RepID=B9BQJ0_9BURK|nr:MULTISPECIES: RNA methyltransferase [Burkholderia cepacia complex]EEE06885.1 tRNA/rRNA methyltransferase [Burkholderia multivorans CGD2]MCA8249143.1 RNA methyltransferase [Burkholderia multivorans]MDN8013544.1 RNA methyltransferase [Burkholderia multivorans]
MMINEQPYTDTQIARSLGLTLLPRRSRGYAAIGLHQPKDPKNIGGVLRAAGCYDAALVVLSGRRYQRASTDTQKAFRHLPVIQTDDVLSAIPVGAVPIAVEFTTTATPLTDFKHPESAFYIFGPEDGSVPNQIVAKCRDVVYVPTAYCMNLAAAVNVLLYDRLAKLHREVSQ